MYSVEIIGKLHVYHGEIFVEITELSAIITFLQKVVSRRRRQIVFKDNKDDELLPLPVKSATAFSDNDHEILLDDVIDWDNQLKKNGREQQK